MGTSPHHYKSAISDANNLISEAQAYLNSESIDGLHRPIRTVTEIQEIATRCSNMIGKLTVLDSGLQKDSPLHSTYRNAIEELESCIGALNKLELSIR